MNEIKKKEIFRGLSPKAVFYTKKKENHKINEKNLGDFCQISGKTITKGDFFCIEEISKIKKKTEHNAENCAF